MTKILHRSRTDRWIAGVCGGIGAYFGVDANAIRLAFVLLALWQGVGLLVYLVMVIIIPDEPGREMVAEPGLPPMPSEDETQRRARMLGGVLVIGGAYLLIRSTDVFAMLLANRGIGVLLIVGGLLLLLLRPPRR